MRLAGPAKWLRIYVGERDHWHGKPLYVAILDVLRHEGIAGATVLRGIAGYGASGLLHTTRIVQLSIDLPVVIEVIDKPERIAALVPKIEEMVSEGLIIIADCEVIAYRTRRGGRDGAGTA
jgi:PII-like signaling protein